MMSVRIPGNYPTSEPDFKLKEFGKMIFVNKIISSMSVRISNSYTSTYLSGSSSYLYAWSSNILVYFSVYGYI